MIDRPSPNAAAILSFMFVTKLCAALERNNRLPAGEAGRLWADVLTELQSKSGQHLERECIDTLTALKLAKP